MYKQFGPNLTPSSPSPTSLPPSSRHSGQSIDELVERRQLLPLDQFELLDEVHEMLEGGVEMCLLPETHDLLKVLVVDVSVHPKQPLQDGLGDRQEVLGKRHADLARKQGLIIQLVLDPGHQVVDIFGRRALDGLLHAVSVRPVVLVLGPRRHDRAAVFRAELRDGAVQHVDLVEEVHGVDGDPLVDVLTVRQHHGGTEVAGAECGVGVLHQVLLVRTFGDILLGLEGLRGPGSEQETHLGGICVTICVKRWNQVDYKFVCVWVFIAAYFAHSLWTFYLL